MGVVFKKLSAFIFRKLLLSNTALTSETKELVLKELSSSSRVRQRKMRASSSSLALKTLTASHLSLTKAASRYAFKELIANAFVAIFSGYGFRELAKKSEPAPETPPIIVPGLYPDNFNLSILGLSAGTYTITATVTAPSLRLTESDHSNSETYTVD